MTTSVPVGGFDDPAILAGLFKMATLELVISEGTTPTQAIGHAVNRFFKGKARHTARAVALEEWREWDRSCGDQVPEHPQFREIVINRMKCLSEEFYDLHKARVKK